jgi:hypothetical protein
MNAEKLVKGGIAKADQAKSSILTNLKAQREKKAKSAPKLDPAPVPEIAAPPPLSKREKAAKAAEARAAKRTKIKGKQPPAAVAPAAVAPEVAPAAARGRSATRTKGAASSSSGVAAGPTPTPAPTQRVGAGPMAKRPASAAKAEPALEVVVAPAPKKPTRGRSSSAATAAQPADTPAPKRLAKAPNDPYKTRANLEYIAANLIEAVKIDGFDVQDAARALDLHKSLAGATEKETKAIERKMGQIWKDNSDALASFNTRLRADQRVQAKRQKKA